MRKSLLAATVMFLMGAASAVFACDGHRPIRYTNPNPPVYQPDPPPEVYAATAPGRYQLAGMGFGGILLAGSALCASFKRP
ncbi:MAG TPA: hypothetical protein VKU82_07455 [Planctomycetaceae bacterium]|nr:hypothetical protein [Planctomycetaceae bacterium]